jgi:hypothetical protein
VCNRIGHCCVLTFLIDEVCGAEVHRWFCAVFKEYVVMI